VAYAFERDESIPGGITRIVREQIERARQQLTDENSPAEERVHDARKRFKETRALLRVVREPLGAQFAVENVSFRDAGRALASVRDADAVFEALEKLELSRWVRARVKKILSENRSHAPLEELIADTLTQLAAAEARVATWPALEDSFDTIAGGLRRMYRDARRAMKHAHSAEEIHEWRKLVKTNWYHAQLLRHVWPPVMKPAIAALDDLSHVLGDHHDLHVLATTIGRRSPSVVRAAAAKQQELEEQAISLGARIFAERPGAWLARMRNYWKSWHKL
jgi:CHAD domain-containing protein